ncbi:uncharacterized protein [Venturia canescens]|uniref:uncharacterized protein n=1 Tax=Venturia canescens TaxID=32260 RepID=UPI001C9D1A03|nr:uncharacterized protein LOC122417957 [Venturia canescens]
MFHRKFIFLLLCAFCHFSGVVNDRGNFFTEEIRSLSELPLDRLIRIRTNLIGDDEEGSKLPDNPARSTALSLPVAQPLKRISTRKSIRRHEDYWDEKGKDSKISKIFQLTVTALSFLAFGGYLISLIIMAIRRNQTAATSGSVIVFSNLQKYKRPKRQAWLIDPMENDFDQDRMYRGMIMLSECYADVRQ